jgi:hypothetical protein
VVGASTQGWSHIDGCGFLGTRKNLKYHYQKQIFTMLAHQIFTCIRKRHPLSLALDSPLSTGAARSSRTSVCSQGRRRLGLLGRSGAASMVGGSHEPTTSVHGRISRTEVGRQAVADASTLASPQQREGVRTDGGADICSGCNRMLFFSEGASVQCNFTKQQAFDGISRNS